MFFILVMYVCMDLFIYQGRFRWVLNVKHTIQQTFTIPADTSTHMHAMLIITELCRTFTNTKRNAYQHSPV